MNDDFFVCGNFFSITCGTWLGFWSGVIGALVAAILSAGVAYLVVRMTNGQAQRGVEQTIEAAALGDCVAAIEGLEWAMRRHEPYAKFDAGTYMIPMRAAVARLQMSREEAVSVAHILIHWPGELSHLAKKYKEAVREEAPQTDDILDRVANVITKATVALPGSVSKDKTVRKDSAELLLEADNALKDALTTYDIPRGSN
ncbi:hypothetical protein [Pseudarthrobacter sp. NIBRBAC000502770]|uniref:hypothetical protein n=1 Tax=Pseudarthrobacter sp. NIBRBAC000502770 TaxID=2590785 RepID=UPI00113FEAA3|nr:hypothetical protein [Pseudarthrobacter sp. NIBRBAC000502770]QDG87141.1 hypothetical protein NIBR502770_00490 [Pseudarthrobacter sp. NIBRBAC000502770]